MLIDWFTVGAQALNFLILVWLMKRFLYKPILNAIATREKRIADQIADADAKQAEALKERDEFKCKNDELDQQRVALVSKATDDAHAAGQQLIDAARASADAQSTKRRETLSNELSSLHLAVVHQAQHEVFAIARKALTDLAATSLEERLGAVFISRLRTMDGQAKALLAQTLQKMSGPTLVRSAFDLPAEQRAAIQQAVNETFSADVHIRFEAAPELICGIELVADGQKLAWSIAEYLALLEQNVGALVHEQATAEPKAP